MSDKIEAGLDEEKYQELITYVKKEYNWQEQFCDAKQGETFKNKVLKVSEQNWTGTNAENWRSKFKKDMQTVKNKVTTEKQEILKLLQQLHEEMSK